MKKLLICYGTLKQGHYNNRLLQHPSVTFLGKIVTEPKFTMISCGGFPAVIPEGKTPITGEVYQIEDEDVLNDVYALEGYSGERNHPANWYDTVDVLTQWGKAEMFVFKTFDKSRPVVKTGEWGEWS